MKHAAVSVVSLGLIVALALAGSSRAEPPVRELKLPKEVDEVLWWLPEDTQTVMVAQGPLKIDFPVPEQKADALGIDRTIPLWTCLILAASLDPALAKRLSDRSISLALEGSRRFRGPKGLGLMPFEGAQILVFQEELGADGKALMDSWCKGATKIQTISRIPVVLREEEWERDRWSIYLAQPKPNVLIGATNRAYLNTVLDRMVTRAGTRALPANLPEWKQWDPTAKVWAIRHFDPKDAQADPSSPLGGKKAANEPDDEAVGLVFWIDPREGGSAKVKYLSNNKDAVRIAQEQWLRVKDSLKKMITLEEAGVVAVSIPLKVLQAEDQGYFEFFLLTALGHGIFL